MKKIKFLSLILVVCMFFTACQGNDGKMNSSANAVNGNNSSGEGNADTSGKVWFPKSAKATSEDGTLQVAIETELDDSKLIYKYIVYYGDSGRYYGFEIGYKGDKITEYYELRGDKSENGETVRKSKKTLEYNDSENTLYLKEFDDETEDLEYMNKYEYKFNDEGKIIEKIETNTSYHRDENNELVESDYVYIDTYKFEYVDGGYNIIWNANPFERILSNGERAECTKQETTFIPYDMTKNHTKTIVYYLGDGTVATLKEDKWDDVLCDGSQKTEYVYNSEGYMIEQYAYLADGTKKKIEPQWECEFNTAGNVKNYTGYKESGEFESKGDFTYDDNGNITNLTLQLEDNKYNVEIEWMLVPKCLDDVNQLIYGNDLYAISELVEDVIPRTDIIDLQDTYYTKEMLEDLLK